MKKIAIEEKIYKLPCKMLGILEQKQLYLNCFQTTRLQQGDNYPTQQFRNCFERTQTMR